MKQELQQQEAAFQAKLKQSEEELLIKAEARENGLQNQWSSDLRTRQEEWERQTEARVRAADIRLAREGQLKEEMFQMKLRRASSSYSHSLRPVKPRWKPNGLKNCAAARRSWPRPGCRSNIWSPKLNAMAEAQKMAEREWQTQLEVTRGNLEPLKALLVRTEKERDEARQAASESARKKRPDVSGVTKPRRQAASAPPTKPAPKPKSKPVPRRALRSTRPDFIRCDWAGSDPSTSPTTIRNGAYPCTTTERSSSSSSSKGPRQA